ncbi:MAG: DUF1732 domain-containing protein [Candidatus Goldbacteria bacterium]|nr:DUF1732 domain-containing protein [Candidatus Goldiibacteriota bacterium]
MPESMTGWGRNNTKEFNVAIRGLNSKYKEIFLHLPQELFEAEPYIYKMINERIIRGRVDVYVNFNLEKIRKKFIINDYLFKDVYNQLNDLYKKFKVKKDIPIEYILKDVEGVASTQFGNSKITIEKLKSAVNKALEDFKKSKRMEGMRLIKDIKYNILKMEKLVFELRSHFLSVRNNFIKKTREKIHELFSKEQNKKFFDMDVVEILEKYDINEELVRLNSHLRQIMFLIKKENSGRKIDFFAQEIYREANTITSKVQESKVTALAINIKEMSEKVRELAQNLE